jgi:lysophospholipase L1-like esterase
MLDGSAWGIAYNWDQTKQNGIIVNVSYGDSVVRLHIEKWLSGHRTEVSGAAFTFATDLELRVSRQGNVIYIDRNNELVTTATISDAAIVNNPYHGIFSTTPANQFGRFAISPFENPQRIFALGDSKTVGAADTPPTAGWSKILATDLGWSLARYAVSGWKTADLKTYIDNNPIPAFGGSGWAIINIGVNDAGATAQSAFEASYAAVLDAIHTALPNYRVLNVMTWASNGDALHDAINQYKLNVMATRPWAEAGIDERIIIKGADNGATLTTDGWHPNHAGHLAEVGGLKTIMGY